jgi:ABC-type antimicrobial peptide transport system permease subunit
LAATVGLSVLLSVSALAGPDGLIEGPRLLLGQDGSASSGLPWSWYARGPGEIRSLGLLDLYYSLLLGTGAALIVTVLTVLSFSAAREREREVELSVRRAVGASRRLLMVAALLESGALVAVVLAVGVPIAMLISSVALRTWPGTLAAFSIIPSIAVVGVMVAAILSGAAVPILFARRKRVVEATGGPLPLVIPAVQLGLSLIVLTMATLLTREKVSGNAGPMTPARNGAVARIALPGSTPDSRAAEYVRILDRFPGASLSAPGVLVGLGTSDVLRTGCIFCPDGHSRAPLDSVTASHRLVSADSFGALNIKLLEGRLLTNQDRMGTAPVVVISQRLANELPAPLGNQIAASNSRETFATVVGIVEDTPSDGFGASHESRNVIYQSVLQHPPITTELLLTPGAEKPDSQALRRRLRALLPADSPAPIWTTEATLLAAEQAPVRWFADRVKLIGWCMLALAFVAILELMRMWVRTLRSDLGIRLAAGATRPRLLFWVLGQAVKVGGVAILVGLWFGPSFWGGLGAVLPRLQAWDPGVLLRYSVLLIAAAVLGAGWPAFRALQSTPAALIASEGS